MLSDAHRICSLVSGYVAGDRRPYLRQPELSRLHRVIKQPFASAPVAGLAFCSLFVDELLPDAAATRRVRV